MSGDNVVLTSGGTPVVNNSLYNLAATLHSVTLNTSVLSGYTINPSGAGNFLGLQSGGFITDKNTAVGFTDTFRTGLTLNGLATITASGNAELDFAFQPIIGTGPLTLVNITGGPFPNANFQLLTVNSYTGATIIGGTHTVVAAVNGAIPTGSALTVNAGASILFRQTSTIGSLAGGGTVIMFNNPANQILTVGGDNTSTVFSGVYTDFQPANGAGLTKIGTGTMTLTGANTYTGPTTVIGGTLVVNGSIAGSGTTVNAGATLAGTGTIGSAFTTINGTIAPGPVGGIGTLTVTGAFTQNAGSTFQVNTAGAASNHLQITGTAALAGNVVVNGTGAPGTYTILSAAAGRTGTYSSLTDNVPFTTAQLIYDPNDVFLVLNANTAALAGLGQTFNQRSAAGGIGAGPLFGPITALNPSQIPSALDLLSGEIHASNVTAGLENHSLFLRTLAERLRQTYCLCEPGNAYASGSPGCEDGNWHTWATPFGQIGSTTGNGNAHGFTFDSVGFAMGADAWLTQYTLAGVALGYDNWFERTHDLGSHASVDSFQMALYAVSHFGGGWVLGSLSYENDGYATTRPIDFLSAAARGSYNGNQVGTYLEGGYNVPADGAYVQPIGALQYISLWRDSFSESGAGAADLNVASARADSFRSYLGGRLIVPMGRDRCWLPEAHAFWVHEYAADTRNVHEQFAGGPSFLIYGQNLGRDWGLFGVGLATQVSAAIRVGIYYDAYVTENGQANGGMGQVQVSW
jgi:autotransporter-associated beta strand protein